MCRLEQQVEFMEGISCAKLAAQLHQLCFTPAWDEASFRSAMEIPGTFFELMSIGPEPAAFALYRQVVEQAEILTLGVLPDFRRQGNGMILLKHGMVHLKSRCSQEIFLDVGEKNFGAIHLYEATGFVRIGRRKNYYQYVSGSEDAIVMKKSL
ncbi:MAG: GNAT family N-acetyltransferase [Sneathiella sp.]|nr:GNAT family N-acetyltransferase [Sneathiella sp.]